MSMVGWLAWLVVVIGILHLAVPSPAMEHDHSGDSTYYAIWLLFAGGVLYLHYLLFAHSGHGQFAVMVDIAGVGIFAVYRALYLGARRFWGGPRNTPTPAPEMARPQLTILPVSSRRNRVRIK